MHASDAFFNFILALLFDIVNNNYKSQALKNDFS